MLRWTLRPPAPHTCSQVSLCASPTESQFFLSVTPLFKELDPPRLCRMQMNCQIFCNRSLILSTSHPCFVLYVIVKLQSVPYHNRIGLSPSLHAWNGQNTCIFYILTWYLDNFFSFCFLFSIENYARSKMMWATLYVHCSYRTPFMATDTDLYQFVKWIWSLCFNKGFFLFSVNPICSEVYVDKAVCFRNPDEMRELWSRISGGKQLCKQEKMVR